MRISDVMMQDGVKCVVLAVVMTMIYTSTVTQGEIRKAIHIIAQHEVYGVQRVYIRMSAIRQTRIVYNLVDSRELSVIWW